MGRNAVHPRIVRGKQVTADEFRRQLFEAACEFGPSGGSIPEIMDYLQIKNDKGPVRDMVRDTLADMCVKIGAAEQVAEREKAAAEGRPVRILKAKNPLLKRVAHGRYAALTDALPARDVSPGARLRHDLTQVFRLNGGFLSPAEALEAFDCRPTVVRSREQAVPLADGTEVPTDIRGTTEFTQIRALIRKHYTRMRVGVYYIGDEEMSRLPLMGRWCEDYFAYQALVRDRLDGSSFAADPYFTHRLYRHFRDLGALTEDLIDRQRLNWVLDLAADPDLADALTLWVETAETWRVKKTFNRALNRHDDGNIFDELVDNKGSPLNAARHYCQTHFPDDPTFHNDGLALLRHFCDGYRCAHETAPLALYKSLSTIFQIDPVLFSRGFEWTIFDPHSKAKPIDEVESDPDEFDTSMYAVPADAPDKSGTVKVAEEAVPVATGGGSSTISHTGRSPTRVTRF